MTQDYEAELAEMRAKNEATYAKAMAVLIQPGDWVEFVYLQMKWRAVYDEKRSDFRFLEVGDWVCVDWVDASINQFVYFTRKCKFKGYLTEVKKV
jgi:hypothetical protein